MEDRVMMSNLPKKPQDAIWNDEQWQAIYEKGHDLLISAGAGSGKTAVLVERMIQKILIDQINIDELLVLTFTEAAAAEMKQRIRSRIEQELALHPHDVLLATQLNKIASANISTFHAFCNKLIRKYYYLLQLDPVFKIADDIEVGILQDDVIEALFDELAEQDDEAYVQLSESFNSDRDDEALKTMVLKVYELARSNPHMEQWLKELPDLYQWEGDDLSTWGYYQQLNHLMSPVIDEALLDLKKAYAFAQDAEVMGVAHKYPTDVYPQDLEYLNRLKEGAQATYAELREAFKGTKLATFPRFNAKQYDKEAHEQSKKARDAFKKRIGKLEEKYFVYTNETHHQHFKASQALVIALSKLVFLFHERFMKAKHERQMLDFSDLEWNTLQLLTDRGKPTEVAKEVYRQFKEIMIDEYQDTNSMQEYIIHSIASVAKPKIPIFMVGDVKQSIYRFRLAEPGIFQEKYHRFSTPQPDGNKIDLMKNYRSHQQVIDATNYVFTQVMDEEVGEIAYDEAAQLKLGVLNEANDAFNKSEIHLIDKPQFDEESDVDLSAVEVEAHHIARLILQWMSQGQEIYDRKKGSYRPLKYQDIVILMRSLGSVTIFQDVFRSYHIPLFTEQNTDLFESIEIINLVSCLKVIDNPYQDIPLAGLMRSPLFFFSERELSMIRVFSKATSFYDLVRHYAKEGEDSLLKEKANHFVQCVEQWRFKSKTMPLSQLITLVYEQTLYYEFVLGLPHGYLRRANLDVFVDKARMYETTTKKGVYGFVRYIERMQSLGKHFAKAKTVTATEDVVRVMSIHKSKGLEFPVVFVSQIHKTFNRQDELGNYLVHKNYGVAVKYIDPHLRLKQKTMAQNIVGAMIHKEMLAEEMRLLYVAMTRAQSKLIFTGVFDVKKKLASMSEIVMQSGDRLPMTARMQAKSYGDWLIPAVLRHRDSKEISAIYCEQQPLWIDDSSEWEIRVVSAYEELNETDVNDQHHGVTPPVIDFEKVFQRQYPYQSLVEIQAKQSVSQRKEEETTPLIKGVPEVKRAVAYDRPSFMKEKQVSGPEAGTALHQFMQHLPIRLDYTLADLMEMKQRVIEKEMMTPLMADKIDLHHVLEFTKSALYHRLAQAITIKKEVPFMTLIQLTEDKGSQVLLQGVIDLLAEFEDEVLIIDYKTDYVRDFKEQYEELKERYTVQMKYYSKAIKEIYPTKTVSCYVYFLKVQEAIVYA